MRSTYPLCRTISSGGRPRRCERRHFRAPLRCRDSTRVFAPVSDVPTLQTVDATSVAVLALATATVALVVTIGVIVSARAKVAAGDGRVQEQLA